MTHPDKMMGVVLEITCSLLNVNWQKPGSFSALLLILPRQHLILLSTFKPECSVITGTQELVLRDRAVTQPYGFNTNSFSPAWLIKYKISSLSALKRVFFYALVALIWKKSQMYNRRVN